MRNPFHDLHHQESGATSHIRLISEGGSTNARAPEMVCIDSIQATQTCTTESQHTTYRSGAACSTALPREPSLCCLGLEYADALDKESLPDLLRHRLARSGSPLTSGARVSVRQVGRSWHIEDDGRAYTVRRVVTRLAVYLEL